MKPLADAIWNVWDGDVPLKTALPRLYFQEAPDDAAMPYGVYWRVSESADRTFAGLSDETIIQFDVFTNQWDATAVMAIEPLHKAAFNEAALVVAGHTSIVMLWEFTEGPLREEDCWHLILQYRVRVKE